MTAQDDSMDADAVIGMVEQDREEWQKLVATLDARPEGRLHDPESPEWTARDVYTHLARLMEGSVRIMDDHLAGRAVSDPYQGADENEVNAQVQQQYSSMSLGEARAWAERSFDALIAKIESVPVDRWDDEQERYARADGAGHYRGHMSYIARD